MIDDTTLDVEIIDFENAQILWMMILHPNASLSSLRKKIQGKLIGEDFIFVNDKGIEFDEEDRNVGQTLIEGQKIFIKRSKTKKEKQGPLVAKISHLEQKVFAYIAIREEVDLWGGDKEKQYCPNLEAGLIEAKKRIGNDELKCVTIVNNNSQAIVHFKSLPETNLSNAYLDKKYLSTLVNILYGRRLNPSLKTDEDYILIKDIDMWGGDIVDQEFDNEEQAVSFLVRYIKKDSRRCGGLRWTEDRRNFHAWCKDLQKTNPSKCSPQYRANSGAIFYGKLI